MRIAIVNDMEIAIEAMRRTLQHARGHELAWIARTGAEAVSQCAKDTPDLVLMDLMMPEMDGIEATRRIMAQNPCAIVVVTGSVNRNSSKVFEAMGAGALDAVNTPTLKEIGAAHQSHALLGKIQTINRLLGGRNLSDARGGSVSARRADPSDRVPLVVIGASAGGPAALATIFSELPAALPAAIIVVQHVDAHFAGGLASWLGRQTKLRVRLAREGDEPQAGTVLLAGMNEHLVFLESRRLGYVAEPTNAAYRPSIDAFFKSVERFWRGDVLGILLTGMGRDGAEGLKTLHRAGHHTIAQDRASSAVFGMPKAAAELRAATEILALEKIGPRVKTLFMPATQFKHG